MATNPDSMKTRGTLDVGGVRYAMHRLDALGDRVTRLPFSLRVLLENLLRHEDGRTVTTRRTSRRCSRGIPKQTPEREIAFMPARVLLQDFTGVPVRGRPRRDARRDGSAWAATRAASTRSRPSTWSSTTRCRSTRSARRTRSSRTSSIEFERNRERYAFLRWGQQAFEQLPRRAAGHRHRAPGEPRVPGAGRREPRRERPAGRLSRTRSSAPTRTPP